MATLLYKDFPQAEDIATAFNATRKLAIGNAGASHYDAAEKTISVANASDLATSLALLTNCLMIYENIVPKAGSYVAGSTNWPGHIADLLAHDAADTANTTGVTTVPTALAAAQTAANTLKSKMNLHFLQAGVHPVNDTTNTITAANATDQTSLNTLLNQIKTKWNAHMADALGGSSFRVVDF